MDSNKGSQELESFNVNVDEENAFYDDYNDSQNYDPFTYIGDVKNDSDTKVEEDIHLQFLRQLSSQWLKYEDKKKKDRRMIGYSLLVIIVLQILFIAGISLFNSVLMISDVVFSVLVTGMFVEMVGLFYIVVTNMFRDDGDQGLKSIVDLISLKNKIEK